MVVTVMSNIGLDIMAAENGIKLVKTKVGDRYVLEEMMNKGYALGGEQSGHIIFLEHNTTGDGLLTALNLLKALKASGKPLSELSAVMKTYPQVLVNAKVKETKKYGFLDDEVIASLCGKLEKEFCGEGRVLIRPSGTEPIIRVMIEGKDQEYILKKATELANTIESRLG
jgi:phosphoglucosamine mutase